MTQITYVGLHVRCTYRYRAGPPKTARRAGPARTGFLAFASFSTEQNATMADNDTRPAAAAAADDDDNSDVEMSGERYDGLCVRFGV